MVREGRCGIEALRHWGPGAGGILDFGFWILDWAEGRSAFGVRRSGDRRWALEQGLAHEVGVTALRARVGSSPRAAHTAQAPSPKSTIKNQQSKISPEGAGA
jgi:hypothetical protein